MRKGGSVRRNRPTRRENKKLLIVTEGEITEFQYLQGLIQHLRTSGVTVAPSAVRHGGGEPSRVLAKARDLAAKGDYEAVWLVVDHDDHASLDDVIRQCATGNELVVVSNPQFEVWLLWHFTEKDTGGRKTTASLKKELRRHGVTGKHLPDTFPFARVDQATIIAGHKSRSTAPNTRGGNPSSAMPHLVKALRRSDPSAR